MPRHKQTWQIASQVSAASESNSGHFSLDLLVRFRETVTVGGESLGVSVDSDWEDVGSSTLGLEMQEPILQFQYLLDLLTYEGGADNPFFLRQRFLDQYS